MVSRHSGDVTRAATGTAVLVQNAAAALLLGVWPGATTDDLGRQSLPVACEPNVNSSAARAVHYCTECQIVLRTPVHQQTTAVCVTHRRPGLL